MYLAQIGDVQLPVLSQPSFSDDWSSPITTTKCTGAMDLLQAADELKNVVHTAQILIAAWEEDPDNYSVIEEHLTDLASELKRIEEIN